MCQPPQCEQGNRSDDCWRQLEEPEKERRADALVQKTGPLRTPPLFRSIGPSGLSASLPPHRRLRSMFRRTRLVLPDIPHVGVDSGTNSFQDLMSDTHIKEPQRPLTHNELVSEKDVDINTISETGQAVLDLPSGPLTAQSRQEGGQSLSKLSSPPRIHIIGRARWGRAVSPLQRPDGLGTGDVSVKERRKAKNRKLTRKGCTGECVASSLTSEMGEDGGLSQWLQSLRIADGEKEPKPPTRGKQPPSGVRHCMVGHRAPYSHPADNHRRDRRPHFLPPICQPGSLLHVPLLLPENSPPPSPCTSTHVPLQPLPVPLLQPQTFRRK